jgi:hypothetical protein
VTGQADTAFGPCPESGGELFLARCRSFGCLSARRSLISVTSARGATHQCLPGAAGAVCGARRPVPCIDLRWGVTTEASLDQRAVAICLEEVDRCLAVTRRPYLMLLLGDRYDWRPPPATVTGACSEQLRAAMADQDAQLVDLWYVEDRNAVPSVYRLQPRRGRYIMEDAWQLVERALHDVLQRAARTTTERATGTTTAGKALLRTSAGSLRPQSPNWRRALPCGNAGGLPGRCTPSSARCRNFRMHSPPDRT